MRPWAIAEDQVKVAASAGHVEVAFSLSKWPLAPVIAGAGAVTGGAGCGVPLRSTSDPLRPIGSPAMPVRTPCPTAPSAAERVRLKKMAYGHKTEHRLRVRAQVVLHAARGRSNACIARETGCIWTPCAAGVAGSPMWACPAQRPSTLRPSLLIHTVAGGRRG